MKHRVKKKMWHTPKVHVMNVNSSTADGMNIGPENIMMGMTTPGS